MPTDPDIVNRIIELLTQQYTPYIKEAILWLETYSGKKSKRSVHELRNALDHIAVALDEETTKEDAIKSLNAIEDHFRRAAVEPAEWLALEEARRLLKIKERGFWWWKLLLLEPVDSKKFNETLYKGFEFIEKGRFTKGASLKKSYENFKQAYIIFNNLLEEVRPSEIRSRIFAVLLSLIFLILGLVLSSVLT